MSGITPIIDTLLHQVLGKRVDIPVIKDQPLPVSAATSSDAIQPARSDSRLHQQGGDRVGAATFTSGREGLPTAPAASGQAGAASTQLHLSQTATQIADILARFPASQTASIRPLIALLPPGADADALATALSQSVRESGVFYESHLQRWVSGQYSFQALMREPQAWLGLTFRPFVPGPLLSSGWLQNAGLHAWGSGRGNTHRGPTSDSAMPSTDRSTAQSSALAGKGASGSPSLAGSSAPGMGLGESTGVGQTAQAASTSSLAATREHQLSQPASEALQSLVRHQLELIVSPNLRWEGQLWPGVPMTLILTEAPDEKANEDVDETPDRPGQGRKAGLGEWRADVQIRLPSLGLIDLIFRARRDAALSVEIEPFEETARRHIEQKLAQLHERLTQVGVTAAVALGKTSRGA